MTAPDFDQYFDSGTSPEGVSGYIDGRDRFRLGKQMKRIYLVVRSDPWKWWTLDAIEAITNDPQSSISADLRSFRKERFGNHRLEIRKVGGPDSSDGLHEYRLWEPLSGVGINVHAVPDPATDVDMMPCPTCEGTGVISA